MVIVGLVLASSLGLGAWLAYRRAPVAAPMRIRPAPTAVEPIDRARLTAANALTTERLWRLGYGAQPTQAAGSRARRINELVRANVVAILDVDNLDNGLFPRRPALLPQLLQAVDDPRTASDKLARMIAHDPVLTGDVLRMANSPMYRVSVAPIETMQRAVAVCGVDALRAMLATAMLRPVFRASSKNFPRLPRILWDRTERASRAAELYAAEFMPQERFESGLVVLLNALGPLVVYRAILDVYARNSLFAPDPSLCADLTGELAPGMARRIARDWQASSRLVSALENAAGAELSAALQAGELLGALSFLESQTVLTMAERHATIDAAGLPSAWAESCWSALARKG